MTVNVDAAFQATAAEPAYAEMVLVELQFRSGTLRLTNWPVPVTVMGETWSAVGTMGQIGNLHESLDGAEEKLDLTLSGADVGVRAAVLSNPTDYQDRRVRVWIALADAQSLQLTGVPVLRFSGVMDQPALDDEKGEITMHCRTASYDVRSNPSTLRYSHAQHQLDHPGELGMEFVESLIRDTSVWLSAAFQRSRA